MAEINDSTKFHGQVVAIYSKREVLVQVYNPDKAFVGVKFAILGFHKITLPNGDEHLSQYAKAIVKSVRSEGPGLLVCRTFRTVTTGFGLITEGEKVETLNVDSQETAYSSIPVEDRKIFVSDPVIEIKGDEYD